MTRLDEIKQAIQILYDETSADSELLVATLDMLKDLQTHIEAKISLLKSNADAEAKGGTDGDVTG